MFHRFSSWWRALGVVLLSLAALTWPSAAQARTTPQFTVVHQNALATLSGQGMAHFSTTLRLEPAKGRSSADVTIYPKATTQAEITPFLSGDGTKAAPLSSTGTFDLDCLHHGLATFDVTIYTGRLKALKRSCDGAFASLRLDCAGATCDGVYPLRYLVDVAGTRSVKWSLLSIQRGATPLPLHVAFVQTLTTAAAKDPAQSLRVLKTLAQFSSSPLTLSADYEALSAIQSSPTNSAPWKSALTKAVASPLHRVIDAPPGDIDFAGLAQNQLTTQVSQQLSLSSNLFRTLTGRFVDGAVLLGGPQSPASLLALAKAGVHNVVLPEADLNELPSSTTTGEAPFALQGVPSITALSNDGPLSALVNNPLIEPGRRAALALCELAFLDREGPRSRTARTIVIEAPVATTSSTFLTDFFNGLKKDQFSHLSSLTPLFNASLIGTNGAPAIRTLVAAGASSMWTQHNVSSLLTLIGSVASYTQGVKTGDVVNQLHVAVARSEISGSPGARQSEIDAASALLNNQLDQFSIDASAVTLAGSGTSLPITVISRVGYTVNAVVHLITDRLSFPKGSAIPVTMNSPTQALRVPTANARGSSLILQVVLTTPNGQVVLARSAIQVRIAGTSVVGYLLTFASLFVLGLWWFRTIRRRTKGRHAK
jgi:hypothetical protein